MPQIAAPRGKAGRLPQQAAGLRPSRALPYELAADATVSARGLHLAFINSGSAGAVFHVYDQRHLRELPRRYTVEAGKSLADLWTPLPTDLGSYDLWLLGPNGFHRQYSGRLGALDRRDAEPEVQARHDSASGELILRLVNAGPVACSFVITAEAYRDPAPRRVDVAAGRSDTLRLDLRDSGRWYDYRVRIEGERAVDRAFLRRCAGRVETGEPSFSDPAIATR